MGEICQITKSRFTRETADELAQIVVGIIKEIAEEKGVGWVVKAAFTRPDQFCAKKAA